EKEKVGLCAPSRSMTFHFLHLSNGFHACFEDEELENSEIQVNRIEAAYQMTSKLTSQDQVASTIQRTLELLDVLKKKDCSEALANDLSSIEHDRLVKEYGKGSKDSLQTFVFDITESIETTLLWMIEREKKKATLVVPRSKNVEQPLPDCNGEVKKEEDEWDELFNLSDHSEEFPNDTKNDDEQLRTSSREMVTSSRNKEVDEDESEGESESDSSENGAEETTDWDSGTIGSSDIVECEICCKKLRRDSLRRHKLIHLSNDDPRKRKVECTKCGKMLANKFNLKQHMETHLEDEDAKKPFKCEECGRGFSRFQRFQFHILTHLPDDDPRKKMFECNVCGKKLNGPGQLKVHMELHLDDNDPVQAERKRRFQCDQCGMRFRCAANLRNHGKNVHGELNAREVFECLECGKKYKKIASLKAHQETHLDASERDDKLECDICKKIVFGRTLLKIHKSTHLDDNDPVQAAIKRQHKCKECGKTFRNASNLRHHMNIHTGNYRFKCTICTTGFNSRGILKKHMENHEKGIEHYFNYNTKTCPYCSKKFRADNHLSKHIQQFHEGKLKCDLCDMRFERHYHMTKIHSGLKKGKDPKSMIKRYNKNAKIESEDSYESSEEGENEESEEDEEISADDELGIRR
ncbi:hypothetical protein PRIPAC_72307, partial [Pristionchus pacificus]